MAVREFLNKHRGMSVGAIVILLMGAIALAVLRNQQDVAQFGPPQDKAFFSSDDGKTYFTMPVTTPSPTDYQGKKAYRCFVFRCDGGKEFVGCLVRDPKPAPAPAAPAPPKPGQPPAALRGGPMAGGYMDLKPAGSGDRGWVQSITNEGMQLMQPRCPDGKLATRVTP